MSLSSGRSSVAMANGRPLCPRCRVPMWAVCLQPERTADHKQKFQCPRCEDSLTKVGFLLKAEIGQRD